MSKANRQLLGYTLAFISALSFSTKGVIAKLLYGYGMEPTNMLTIRFAIAAPLFWIMLFIFPSERMHRKDIFILILSGIVGIFISALADFYGLKYMEASLERLVVYTYPVIVLLLSALMLKKPLTRSIIFPLIVTYTGLAIALEVFTGGLGGHTGIGVLFVLIAAFFFALAQVITESVSARVSAVKITAISTTAAGCAFISTSLLGSGIQLPTTGAQWSLILLLSVLATFIPFITIVMSIKIIGASHTAMISFIGPVSTAIIARFFLGEELTPAKLAGMATLMIGVYLLARSRAKG